MKTKDFLKEHNACFEGAKWALSISEDMSDVWNAMVEQGKYDWLIWTATRPGVFSDSVLRKLACRLVRETPLSDDRKVWDLLADERSRKAVEVAERYADGNATDAELSAACGAACVAADAAAPAGANAAANAANAAAYAAARAAAYTANVAADAALWAAARAADAAYAAAKYTVDAARAAAFYDASADAKSAQVQMIAELGNPFKKGKGQ